jgi:hypothetical protein
MCIVQCDGSKCQMLTTGDGGLWPLVCSPFNLCCCNLLQVTVGIDSSAKVKLETLYSGQ